MLRIRTVLPWLQVLKIWRHGSLMLSQQSIEACWSHVGRIAISTGWSSCGRLWTALSVYKQLLHVYTHHITSDSHFSWQLVIFNWIVKLAKDVWPTVYNSDHQVDSELCTACGSTPVTPKERHAVAPTGVSAAGVRWVTRAARDSICPTSPLRLAVLQLRYSEVQCVTSSPPPRWLPSPAKRRCTSGQQKLVTAVHLPQKFRINVSGRNGTVHTDRKA